MAVADCAHAMLKMLDHDEWLRKAPISNTKVVEIEAVRLDNTAVSDSAGGIPHNPDHEVTV
ncbi:MAG: hypothetical protein ACR2PT_04005 [Endozoicomonas sp.]